MDIIFSDESCFNLSFNDGRVRCWRSLGELNDSATFNNVVRSVMSVMFWGCISIHGIWQLVLVDGNMDQFKYINILDEKLLPSVENMFGDVHMQFIFMHDNVPYNKARTVDRWFDEKEIQMMQ